MVDNKGNIEYDIIEAGRVLVHYIANVDSIQSSIGEYKSSRVGNKMYKVTGYQLVEHGEPLDILSTLDTEIEITDKFKGYKDKSAISILNNFLNTQGVKSKNQIVEKFKGISNNTVLLVPFKVGSDCTYIHKANSKEESTKITSILWSRDREDGKFKSNILVKTVSPVGASITKKVCIDEYNSRFRVRAVEGTLESSKVNRDIIKVDRFGLVHPIEIKDRNISIAVDCLNVYLVLDGEISIIGRFDDNAKLHECSLANSVSKHKAYKHFKDNLDYITKHLRFIAPYKLVSSTEITV